MVEQCLWAAPFCGEGVARSVGFLASRPCLTASLNLTVSLNAARRMVTTYRTVRADNPPLPSARPEISGVRIQTSTAGR